MSEQDIPFPDSKPAKPKKRTAFSSTAATLKWARGVWGDEAVTVSSWWLPNQGIDKVTKRPRTGGNRKDLWGFQDAQVLDGLPGVLALQACGADVSSHKRKMDGDLYPTRHLNPDKALKASIDAAKLAGRVRRWLAAGNRLLLVSWREVWVKTSDRHQTKKRAPRFLEARLEPMPPGMALGLSDREVEWIEHETWPPIAAGRSRCPESPRS